MTFLRVRGTSMSPGLKPGDRLRLETGRAPRRGDLVVLLAPGAARPVLKRVVGMPGERIFLEGTRVLVDGRLLEEPYVDARAALEPLSDRGFTLGSSEYVVLGDARDDSLDSRRFGPVRSEAILGVAVQ